LALAGAAGGPVGAKALRGDAEFSPVDALHFVNSGFTGQLLEQCQIPAKQVRILPGGVDVPDFAQPQRKRADLGLAPNVFYLLTACRLVEKKA
jgi:hypothetical protein